MDGLKKLLKMKIRFAAKIKEAENELFLKNLLKIKKMFNIIFKNIIRSWFF
jgi:hypothetical protein